MSRRAQLVTYASKHTDALGYKMLVAISSRHYHVALGRIVFTCSRSLNAE